MPFKMHDEGQIHKLLFYYWSHLAIFNELKFAGHARSLFFFSLKPLPVKDSRKIPHQCFMYARFL